MSSHFNIPPDAVRVWRGFRQASLPQAEFFKRLGETFIPSTVEMQIQNGLDVYIPTIPCGLKNKPDTVPDETAILFWDSQQTYHDGFLTLAGRTYTLTHGGCYTPESRADFPILFSGKLALNTCYYLIDKSADWMHGNVHHLVAQAPKDGLQKYQEIIAGIQERGQVDGAIVCVGDDYIVYWQLNGEADPGFQELATASEWKLIREANPYHFPKGSALWDKWPGMNVVPGDSFNMQFIRQFELDVPQSQPVAPDSVHVWRGYRNTAKTPEEFADFLGSVFLPTGSLLQPNAGLHAFFPSLPNKEDKPGFVPDQTALMFWTDQQAYHDGFKKVAVRAYTNLHGDAYRKGSTAEFPIYLGNTVQEEQPYFLIDQPADWMLGNVQHLVGSKKDTQSSDDFLAMIHHWAAAIRDTPPKGLEGALLCAGMGYVVVWLCWNPTATATSVLDSLANEVNVWLLKNSERYELPAGLWDDWTGIPQEYPSSLNIQLKRPQKQ